MDLDKYGTRTRTRSRPLSCQSSVLYDNPEGMVWEGEDHWSLYLAWPNPSVECGVNCNRRAPRVGLSAAKAQERMSDAYRSSGPDWGAGGGPPGNKYEDLRRDCHVLRPVNARR